MPLLRAQLQAALGSTYTIERELGGGGMSRVFAAREDRLGRTVVIKVLPSASELEVSAERFEREIRMIASLQDPHIVPILTVGVAAGFPYYTMPFVDGESLRHRLDRVAPATIPIAETIAILSDIATALECAHSNGLVHRDIKPENVLLAGRTAVVADFGIAKALSTAFTGRPSTNPTLTRAGIALGTPGYMAPEQAVGAMVDQRTDIYAWGVIAYELLSGAHPFASRENAQQLIAAHIVEVPLNLRYTRPEVPPELAALVMRSLEKDPAHRPQSAGEIVRALGESTLLAPTTPGSNIPLRSRAHLAARWTAHNAAAALLSVAVIAAISAGRDQIARTLHLSGADTEAATSIVATKNSRTPEIRTVAVLPFVNVGGNSQDEYFSDGMTDELAQALSQLPSVHVAARTSGYAFKGKTLSAQEIGRVLNVAGVVEGTVRRAGDRLRVTAELINTRDGLVVWSNSYDSRAKDVFEIQDGFTRAIVNALTPTLGGEATHVASRSRGTDNAAAYDLYLKGRYFWNQRSADGLNKAVTYFERAIALDSMYARAYAGLGDSYAVLAPFGFLEPRIAFQRAKPAVLRALQLDSTLAEAHTSLGFIHLYYDLDLPAADSELKTAVALDPSYATAHLFRAWYLLAARQPDAAVREAAVAHGLEPLSLIINTRLATMLMFAGRYDEAMVQLRKTLELNATFGLAHEQMARVLLARGDYAGAILNARLAVSEGYPAGSGTLGFALAKSGQRVAAQAILDSLSAGDGAHYIAPFAIGLIYTGLGDDTHAIEWLGRVIDARDPEALHLNLDPLLARLHADPRFVAVVARTVSN